MHLMLRRSFMPYNRELNSLIHGRFENSEIHLPYEGETYFYDLIASGNIEKIREIASEVKDPNMYENASYGQLSSNPLRNAKYHVIISVALVTRYCISHGLDPELAYSMSDIYIKKIDEMPTCSDVIRLHGEMIMDFTSCMAQLPKNNVYSLQTIQAIDYVCSHYTEDINVDSIAAFLGINRSYLSRIFKENTGKSLGEFIRSERIKAACNMLKFSDYSCLQVAEYLHFSSQSHFISCFKKEMGCTPAKYRASVHPAMQ